MANSLLLDIVVVVAILLPFAVAAILLLHASTRRRFYRRISQSSPNPVVVFDSRGRLAALTPGLLIFQRRPPAALASHATLLTHLSHTKNRVEIDSIVYCCTLKSLVDRKWGKYCVVELEKVGRTT